MKTGSGILATGILLAILCGSAASEQPDILSLKLREFPRYFEVEYAIFPADMADTARLELYLQVYNHLFDFELKDKVYEAAYELTIDIRDKKGRPVENRRLNKSIKVASEWRTS